MPSHDRPPVLHRAYRADVRRHASCACDPRRQRRAFAGASLDRTAFYPTSGGQPFDIGTLGGARVLDVDRSTTMATSFTSSMRALTPGAAVERRHRLDAPLRSHAAAHRPARAVGGVRSAVRRPDRELSSRRGVGHDRSGREVTRARDRARSEDEANRIVWEDRPVAIRFVTAEEAAALPLRKEPARTGPLRLIDVEDFDLSACGGTHVARTGAIGIIASAAGRSSAAAAASSSCAVCAR